MERHDVRVEPAEWEDPTSGQLNLTGNERDYLRSRSDQARTYRLARSEQVGRVDVLPVAGGEWLYLLGHGPKHRIKDMEVSRLRYPTRDQALEAAIEEFAAGPTAGRGTDYTTAILRRLRRRRE